MRLFKSRSKKCVITSFRFGSHPFVSRLWACLTALGWIRVAFFAKLILHIYIDLDKQTRTLLKSDGVFRVSSARLLALVLSYEIPMCLLQRFLVEKFVVYPPQLLKLFLHSVSYIAVICHFLSLKKFYWCATRWGTNRSYYALVTVFNKNIYSYFPGL